MEKDNAIYSTMVRSGRTTYFVNIREAKNGSKYLSISERKVKDGKSIQGAKLKIDTFSMEQFRQAIDEAVKAVP